jgi:hypothetical protein
LNIDGEIREHENKCWFENFFLGEAILTTNYLTNRPPSSVMGEKTQEESWSGEKFFVSHPRVFGCEAYMHVPKVNMKKLKNKSIKCIFVGYIEGVKHHKLHNLFENRHTHNLNVIFK